MVRFRQTYKTRYIGKLATDVTLVPNGESPLAKISIKNYN